MKKKISLVLAFVLMLSTIFSINVLASESKPYYCYTLSTGNVPVYKETSLKTKYGTIYGSSDEIQVININGSVANVKYPVTNKSGKITGYKKGYVNKNVITKGNLSKDNTLIAPKKITSYRRKDGKVSYGYISKGDKVWLLTTSGGYTQVLYPISKGYKIAWVKTNDLNNTSQNNKTDSNSNTTSNNYKEALDKMMNGTSYNGAYKLNTKYKGEYASEQCKGFAKSIHKKLFGYNIGSTKNKPNNHLINYNSKNSKLVGSIKSMSTTSAKKLFTKAKAGDFVQMRRKHGGSHSAIVYATSSTGITFYEANIDGKNGIVKKTYTWKNLCSSNAAMALYSAKNY